MYKEELLLFKHFLPTLSETTLFFNNPYSRALNIVWV